MRQAERIRYLVLAAQREGNRALGDALLPLGLTPEQSEVLRILGDHGSLTVKGVGEMLVCESGTNPSRLVDRLVRAGLVERTPDADDRRRMNLSLTPQGADTERLVRVIENDMYALIDQLPNQAEVIHALGALVKGRPSGEALSRRMG